MRDFSSCPNNRINSRVNDTTVLDMENAVERIPVWSIRMSECDKIRFNIYDVISG
jgi:hypothetical protein